jgi:hypothetical protein
MIQCSSTTQHGRVHGYNRSPRSSIQLKSVGMRTISKRRRHDGGCAHEQVGEEQIPTLERAITQVKPVFAVQPMYDSLKAISRYRFGFHLPNAQWDRFNEQVDAVV